MQEKKSPLKNHYDVLGVSNKASEQDIKKAFKALSLRYHPDRNPGNVENENKFKEIVNAYTLLTDTEQRAKYDLELNSLQNHDHHSPVAEKTSPVRSSDNIGSYNDINKTLSTACANYLKTRGWFFSSLPNEGLAKRIQLFLTQLDQSPTSSYLDSEGFRLTLIRGLLNSIKTVKNLDPKFKEPLQNLLDRVTIEINADDSKFVGFLNSKDETIAKGIFKQIVEDYNLHSFMNSSTQSDEIRFKTS